MDIFELVARMGGEIVRGRARVLRRNAHPEVQAELLPSGPAVNGYILLGQHNGSRFDFTPEGARLAAAFDAADAASEAAPATLTKAVKKVRAKPAAKPAPALEDNDDELDDIAALVSGLE